ncbi:hypothetical protein OG898_22165 [Streptomyces sp. NBC_00193]|uniref:hypothetical protein n=1 Tax=Streptomyces sp. NBC_00193 TaxID=2975675 RepID=UPI00224DCEFD|nr:hypothetical protein [Streptomyces sp. NBC_00193]MCX5299163.1 hypothetical protein [Streptomyces sp. NBC_00193]
MRKRTLAVLCTATALAGGLLVPTAAQAAEPFPAGFKAWTHDERVYVDFGTAATPKDLKVHLRKTGTDTPVATVTAFRLIEDDDPCNPSCGDDPGTTALETAPLKLAELAKYSVDVEYDGTAGEPILHKDRATLDYQLIPKVKTFEVLGTPDLEHRTVTVKADAVARDPRDDSERPLPNGKLVAVTTAGRTPFTTDASGHLEAPLTFTGTEKAAHGTWHQKILVVLRPDGSDTAHGKSLEVEVKHPYTRIVLDTNKVTGPDQSSAPVSGQAFYHLEGGTEKPLPVGTLMTVYNVQKFKSGPDGRFTVQVPIDGTRPQRIVILPTAWLPTASAYVASDPTTSAGFHDTPALTVNANRTVTLSGKFRRYDIPAPTPLKVEVQFTSDGTTWTTVKTLTSTAPAGTSTATVTAKDVPYTGPGQWRLRYAGTSAIPSGAAVPTTGRPGVVETALPEFNAAPEPVKAGKPITITGKLTREASSFTGVFVPAARQTVEIWFRPNGTTAWKAMGTARTDDKGLFTRAFTAAKDGYWQARYTKVPSYHFSSQSREDFVDVQ